MQLFGRILSNKKKCFLSLQVHYDDKIPANFWPARSWQILNPSGTNTGRIGLWAIMQWAILPKKLSWSVGRIDGFSFELFWLDFRQTSDPNYFSNFAPNNKLFSYLEFGTITVKMLQKILFFRQQKYFNANILNWFSQCQRECAILNKTQPSRQNNCFILAYLRTPP